VVRGGTSALGQAAIDIARALGARVFATSRTREKFDILEARGAVPLVDAKDLSREIRGRVPGGVDAVLDVVGTSTLLDSLKMARYRGRVAMAGFLGGGSPLEAFDPLRHLPSGVALTFSASAFLFGTPDLPLADIPFDEIVRRTEAGEYRAQPAHVYDFDAIVEAHRLLESGAARGKVVVRGAP
jgi:NADPH:quinone reductase-like Zn-dependent oxidoreductase